MASINVEFKTSCESASAEYYLSVELDDILNTDRTCFLYGQKVYFKVYHSANLSISVASSAGTIRKESNNVEGSEEETISFENTNESSLSKIIKSITAYIWYGRSLGSILKTGNTSVRSAQSGVAISKINYKTQYDSYSIYLADQGVDSYPVLVLVTGNV